MRRVFVLVTVAAVVGLLPATAVAEDNKVVVRNHWIGTDAATKQRLEFSGIVIWRIAKRQIVERWAYLESPHHVRG